MSPANLRPRAALSTDAVRWYDTHASELAPIYESVRAEKLHAWMADLLPPAGARALDVGAGTGRDAAWLAGRGLEVFAVEPSSAMRARAAALHAGDGVRWIADALPELREVMRTGLAFDLVLLSAVWMHVPERERARAFSRIITLLKPGGLIAISLRFGTSAAGRTMRPVSEEEVERLARAHGASVERRVPAQDQQGRPDVSWVQMAVRLAGSSPEGKAA